MAISYVVTYPYCIFGYLNYCNSNLTSVDEKWTYVGWGLGIGFIAWFFFCFDYVKRDGSFGSCLFAVILYPITIYYGIYMCIIKCINMLKQE
jgi:hypothetical protein